jgi:hypothetical protein
VIFRNVEWRRITTGAVRSSDIHKDGVHVYDEGCPGSVLGLPSGCHPSSLLPTQLSLFFKLYMTQRVQLRRNQWLACCPSVLQKQILFPHLNLVQAAFD